MNFTRKRVFSSSLLSAAVFAAVLSIASVQAAGAGKAAPIVVADIGLSTPESIEYAAADDVYLVANINGDPLAADGNGFISKVGPDGRVIALKWIEGGRDGVELNAPKGMAIAGGRLYVADIDHVRVFALSTGKPLKSFPISGSTFLNGMAAAADGTIYVTDTGFGAGFKETGTDAVYKLSPNGKYRMIAKDTGLDRPNGVIEDGKRVIVVGYGGGKVVAIDRAGKWQVIGTSPKGGVDGLIKLGDGRLVMTSWGGSALYAMKRDGSFDTLLDAIDAPADIALDTKRNRVLVPLFKQNKLVFLPL